jgi:hypothetical protein
MMADRATDRSARHRMMTRQVASHATYRSTLNTAVGAGNDRQCSGKSRESNHQHYFIHIKSTSCYRNSSSCYRNSQARRHGEYTEREQIGSDRYQDRPTVHNDAMSPSQIDVHAFLLFSRVR